MSSIAKACKLGLPVLAAALIISCSHQRSMVAPEVPAQPVPTATPAPSPEESEIHVSQEPAITTAETPESGVSSAALPADLEQLNRAGYLTDVFFDTDKSDLRPDARDTLATDAAWLRDHPSIRIQVEGHCDERNTEEYNLALGWRRANGVKSYLISLGVAGDRISAISYGEERPFALGHNEAAWSQNRRVHFVITAR
jgi:peptidoglycan-associated lipoprotein